MSSDALFVMFLISALVAGTSCHISDTWLEVEKQRAKQTEKCK